MLATTETVTAPANPVPFVIGIIIFILLLVAAKARKNKAPSHDEQRMFTTSQRMEAKRRAGDRCEHANAFGIRCRQPGAHGDHIFPWSKGGATAMSNQAWLCAPHNLSKGATIPSWYYIRSLERRRRRYFPEGVDPHVEWRIGRAQ